MMFDSVWFILIHFDSITFPTYLGRLALEVGLFGLKNIPKPKMVSYFGPLNNKALFRHLEVWKWLVGGHDGHDKPFCSHPKLWRHSVVGAFFTMLFSRLSKNSCRQVEECPSTSIFIMHPPAEMPQYKKPLGCAIRNFPWFFSYVLSFQSPWSHSLFPSSLHVGSF